MGHVNFVRQPRASASRLGLRRERVSIDFRQHGPALAAIAHSRRMTTAALARSVLGDWLMTQSVDSSADGAMGLASNEEVSLQQDAPFAKVTLRMPANRAVKLARQARAAELSQGMYVAQLVDAQSEDPVDASPRELVAALVRSNAELAALHSNLKALARALKQASSPELADLDLLVAGLSGDVGQHLISAASQISALPASWRRPAGKAD